MKIIGVKMHNRTGELTDFVEFRLSEVNFIFLCQPTGSNADVPAYHTSSGTFIALSTIKDISAAYAEYGFEPYDRSYIVNISRIKDLKPLKRGTKVIFTDNSNLIVRKNV